MPACEGQTVGVLRVWHEQPRPEYGEREREIEPHVRRVHGELGAPPPGCGM